MTNKTEMVLISEIKKNDTIIINSRFYTVGEDDIKYCPFMGISLFGDTFNLGSKKVERVLFRRWRNSKIRGWYAQI